MANVAFKKGLLAGLPSTYVEGTFYVTTDERAIYLDVDNSTRIRLGDFQEFATLAALQANTNPSTSALYYISGLNVLAKWNGTEYVQINLDTGATSFEVVGKGNAVTAVSYDATTRKLTLTNGETFATRAYVGEIPEGYTEETIVAYINKKAEETLNAASGGSSESAASVLAALNTYKAENDPKVTDLQTRMAAAEGEIDALQEIDHEAYKAADEQVLADAKAHAEAQAGAVDTKLTEEVNRAKAAEEANAAAAKAADDKAVAAQEDVDALADKVGEVPADKTVVQMISEAQTAATYDDTQVKADIKANADAIDVLNGSGEGSVDKKITDAFNDFSTKVTDDAVVNSYKELIDWAAEHGSEAAEMAAAITTLQNILEGIGGEGESATVVAYVNSAIEALKIGDYAKAADLTALAGRVAAIEGDYLVEADKTELSNAIAAEKTRAEGIEAGLESRLKAVEDDYLKAADKEELQGDIADAQAAAEQKATDLNTAMDTRVKALEGIDHEAYKAYADQAETDAVSAAKTYADGLAANYDASGSAAAAESAAKAYTDAALAWGSF